MSTQKTALFEEHLAANAKIVDFAGWEMPIQYKNLKEEVTAIREKVGVFDVSHMGEFFVEGPQALDFIDFMVTNDIKSAEMKKAIYSPLCRENGTIIDDLIVYKLEENRLMICVNASNIQKDFNWLNSHVSKFDCKLTDRSSDFSLLALQGPATIETLKNIDLGFSIEDIPYYSIQIGEDSETPILLARTGYTGEDGFEIFGSHHYIKALWSKLMEAGVTPCGLGARDVLRLEVCYPLYGHELNDNVTPLDAGLKWTVKMEKRDFIGKAALTEYQPKFRLLKLLLEKGIPREGYSVEKLDGTKIGEITSGTMSVILKKGIALARIDKNLYSADDEIVVDIRGKKYKTMVNKKPFVAGGHK
ncbi:MAG: aminomethyltransferase [Bacteriovoracaceae bacterium]|jgi:aminomethyltransferase